MDISQTAQDTTKGKLPHGKEPEPFKDEVDKTQKVINRKKRKIPSCKDPNTYEKSNSNIPIRNWKEPFLTYFIPRQIEIILDEDTIELHKTQVTRAIARYQREKELRKEEVDKTQKVDGTKGKLDLEKDLELFKEEADKTQKVDSTKGKLACEKELELFKEEVDKTQKVDGTKGKLPRGKKLEPFMKVDTKPKLIMKNQKLPSCFKPKIYEDMRLSNGTHPYFYDEMPSPIESSSDEETIATDDTQVARALARSECEKEPELSKEEVDKTQKVDGTKGKLPRGKEPEPFKGNNQTM